VAVRAWVLARSEDELYTTSMTIAEIRYGIERLPTGRRKELLRTKAAEVFAAFENQILPFDTAAAQQYAAQAVGPRPSRRWLSPTSARRFPLLGAAVCLARCPHVLGRAGPNLVLLLEGQRPRVSDPWPRGQEQQEAGVGASENIMAFARVELDQQPRATRDALTSGG